MFRKRLLWIVALLLLFSVSVTSAQDSAFSLRDLAERNNVYIGAAVYTTHLNDPVHVETLSREFNMLTPEQQGKHCEIEPTMGQFDFTALDELVTFAEEHDMAVHGHTLVWHSCTPQWVADATFTREEAIEHLRTSITTIVEHYKGRIPIWDVVNEGIADSGASLRDTPWRQLIGDDYIELAFQFAHEADPDALLFYNDYGTEGMNAKSNAVYEMVSDFVARGIPIHGVGLQSHFTVGSFDPDQVAQNIARLGELGLQVQLTEIDVRYSGEANDNILQRQASDYYRLMDVCLADEACTAFITWGVTDKYTWLRGANLGFYNNPSVEPLLFDDDYQPKPAYFAVLDALARKAGEEPVLSDEELEAMLGGVFQPTVEIPPPTKSSPGQEAPDTVPGVVYYAAFPITITVDGDAGEWERIPRATIDSGPVVPQDNDTTMTFAAVADDTNLYFLAEVMDGAVSFGTHDPATAWYQEDSVEFYLNTTGDLSLTAYQPGIAQIGIMAANIDNDDPAAPLIGGGNSADLGVNAVVVPTDTGYLIEASVPLVTDAWTIEPKQAGVLGFQVHLNGSRTPDADRDTKLIWSLADTQDQSYSNPSLFGQLIFWNKNL
jgi:GH35 family endo-1,4-beta-xylanase